MSPGRYPDLAAAIRSARLRKGLTQERAAGEVGVSRFHWIRWEQGLHMPSGEHREALVALGVPAHLFDDIDDDEGESVPALLRRLADRFEAIA